MTEVFEYRPKYVDIRVKKPGAKTGAASAKQATTEHACDYVGCKEPGDHRAPKGRERANEYWHFCREHVTDYNRRWDYFAGMSDAELVDYQAKEEIGHRPTWSLRGRGDRLSAAMSGFRSGKQRDPFGMFGVTGEAPVAAKAQRRLTRMQTVCLEVLSLGEDATGADIRAKYAELVKRWHPDSNGGDRGAETNLQRVIKAYQTLKAAGFV